jgi:hypothetical protein
MSFLRIGKIAVFALPGRFGFGAVSATESLSHCNADGGFDGLLDRIGRRQRLARADSRSRSQSGADALASTQARVAGQDGIPMAGAASVMIARRTDYWDERPYLQADPLATSQITPAPTLQYQVTAASRQIWWCGSNRFGIDFSGRSMQHCHITRWTVADPDGVRHHQIGKPRSQWRAGPCLR